jgi:hypothetical protein
MPFRNRLRDELGRWKRPLFEAPLYGLLFLALVVTIGAYQVKRPLRVDIGGIHDTPYLNDFFEAEPSQQVPLPKEDLRWTRERSAIRLRGIGRQSVELHVRLQAFRPAGLGAPQASLWVGGASLFSSSIGPQWHIYKVLVPAHLLPAGDLHLEFRTQVFEPSGDPRSLGVAVDWIEVHPGEAGWVEPAWAQVGSILGVTLLTYLLLRRWGLSQRWSGAFTTLTVGLLAYLVVGHRLSLTFFTPTAVSLLAWGCLLTAVFLPFLEAKWLREGRRALEARLLWAILLLGFLLRLGGMLYPQFRSSDLIFHAHRAEWVASGNLLFTADLPDVNIPAPYPPGFYVSTLPAALLSPDLPLLIQVAGVTLDAVAGLLLYLLARRLTGRHYVALLALVLQELAPVTYQIHSWGNYTNLFSRTALVAVLYLLCVGRWRWGRRGAWALLVGACSLVLLGHFADSLIFTVLMLTTIALGLLTPTGRRATAALLTAFLTAGLLALVLYYSAPPGWDALLQGLGGFLRGEGRRAVVGNPLHQFIKRVQAPLALLALPGLALLPQSGRRWPRLVLLSTLLTATAFFFGQALFGFSSRYSLFVLPVLALGTANSLAAIRQRGRTGRLVVGILLTYLLWNGLWVWGQTIAFGQR